MKCGRYRLDYPFKLSILKLVQKQREENRNREAPQQAVYADQNRIAQKSAEIGAGKKLSEIPQPGPWASQNPPADGIVLESDQDSIQRIVGKHREENHHRYQHEHKLAVSAQTFPECLSFHGLRPP